MRTNMDTNDETSTHRSMAGRPEGFVHALLGACENIRTRAHGASDQHWLTRQLVTSGK